jgi:hypothetical protein
MQRIVHGHYADPESTRDITGIKKKEFEMLVAALKHYNQSYDMLLSATATERKSFFVSTVNSGIVSEYPGCNDPEEFEQAIKYLEDDLIEKNNIVYEILVAINQSYPGAEYDPPSPPAGG